MDITDIGSIFSSLGTAIAQSSFFFYVKLIAAFAIAVLLIADILLLSKRVRTDMRIALYGSGVPRVGKSKYISKWQSIERRLDEKTVSGGKLALIEADKMLDEILGKLGYAGKDASEKIKGIKSGQIVGVEDLHETQVLHEKIIDDPAYETSFDEIRSALRAYERVFRGLNIIN